MSLHFGTEDDSHTFSTILFFDFQFIFVIFPFSQRGGKLSSLYFERIT